MTPATTRRRAEAYLRGVMQRWGPGPRADESKTALWLPVRHVPGVTGPGRLWASRRGARPYLPTTTQDLAPTM